MENVASPRRGYAEAEGGRGRVGLPPLLKSRFERGLLNHSGNSGFTGVERGSPWFYLILFDFI